MYSVGASYTLSNMPLTIGASYTSFDGGGPNGEAMGIDISYSFGGPSDERLFSSRGYPYELIAAGGA